MFGKLHNLNRKMQQILKRSLIYNDSTMNKTKIYFQLVYLTSTIHHVTEIVEMTIVQ